MHSASISTRQVCAPMGVESNEKCGDNITKQTYNFPHVERVNASVKEKNVSLENLMKS